MARDRLTAKQALFVKLYASGRFSKTKAYQEAGYMRNGSKRAQQVEACKLSRLPHVAQAILEFQNRLLPIGAMRTERINAIRTLKTLSSSSHISGRVRLQATLRLYQICSEGEARELTQGQRFDPDHLIRGILQELRRAAEEVKG